MLPAKATKNNSTRQELKSMKKEIMQRSSWINCFKTSILIFFVTISTLLCAQGYDDPILEDRIFYTCETYTDGGTYRLNAKLDFGLKSFEGKMDITWYNDRSYSENPRLGFKSILNSSKISEEVIRKEPVFIVQSSEKITRNSIKLILPMRVEVYGKTMGELHINGESFEVQCLIEVGVEN